MSGDIHGQGDGEADGFANLLQIVVDVMKGCVVLLADVGFLRDDGKEAVTTLLMIALNHGLHFLAPLHGYPLPCLAALIREDSVPDVISFEFGNIYERHAAGVEAEHKYVSGKDCGRRCRQVEVHYPGDVGSGYASLGSLGYARIDKTEGMQVGSQTFVDGSVIDSTEDAHKEGDGIQRHAFCLQP